MKRYSKLHTWIEVEGDTAVVGISQFAADEMNELTYVELPEPGKELNANEAFGSVESLKAAEEVFLPVAGTVSAVNDALEANPELVSQAPEAEGWLLKIVGFSQEEIDKLMSQEEYSAFVKFEK